MTIISCTDKSAIRNLCITQSKKKNALKWPSLSLIWTLDKKGTRKTSSPDVLTPHEWHCESNVLRSSIFFLHWANVWFWSRGSARFSGPFVVGWKLFLVVWETCLSVFQYSNGWIKRETTYEMPRCIWNIRSLMADYFPSNVYERSSTCLIVW